MTRRSNYDGIPSGEHNAEESKGHAHVNEQKDRRSKNSVVMADDRFLPSGATRRVFSVVELNLELKKRKKFEPTSIARPASSAASICSTEVMPLLPSVAGQSL